MRKKTFDEAVQQITTWYVEQDCGYKTKCWIYSKAKDKYGYGAFKFECSWKAHRFSYLVHKGDPGSALVCHHCDNPPCIRPSHLFLGTPVSNMKDRNAKGRTASGIRSGSYTRPGSRRVGVKNGRAKLNEIDVVMIRTLIKNGLTTSQICEKYPVSHATIDHIRQNRVWRHV